MHGVSTWYSVNVKYQLSVEYRIVKVNPINFFLLENVEHDAIVIRVSPDFMWL